MFNIVLLLVLFFALERIVDKRLAHWSNWERTALCGGILVTLGALLHVAL